MTYVSQTDVAITLATAASIIRDTGWAIGYFGEPGGPYCAYGALWAAANGRTDVLKAATHAVEDHLRATTPEGTHRAAAFDQIVYWNDHLAVNEDAVTDVLFATAQDLISTTKEGPK